MADREHEFAGYYETPAVQDERMEEAVARAIYDIAPQLGWRDRPGSPPANFAVPWDHAAEALRIEAREQAKAAIQAMSLYGGGERTLRRPD